MKFFNISVECRIYENSQKKSTSPENQQQIKRSKGLQIMIQLMILFMLLTNQLSAQGKVYRRYGDQYMNNYRSGFNYFDNGDEIAVFNTSSAIQGMLSLQWTILKTNAQTGLVSKIAFECISAAEVTEVITYPDNSFIIVLSNFQNQFFIFKFSENNDLLWNKTIEIQTFSYYYKNAAIDNGLGGLYLMVSDYEFSGIINIDYNGTIVWSRKVKGNGAKSPGFYICRNLNGGVIGTLKNDYYQCVFSLNQNGEEIWSKTFMDSQYRWPKKIMPTQDGNFLVAGNINHSLAYYNKISPSGQLIFAKTLVITDLDNGSLYYLDIQDLKLDNLENKYALFTNVNSEISVCKIDSAHQIIDHQLITNTYNNYNSLFATNSSKLGFNTNMFDSNYHMTMEMNENLNINCTTIPIGGLSIINDEEMLNSTVLEGISLDNLIVNILPSSTTFFPTANNIQISDYCSFASLEGLNQTVIMNIFPNPTNTSFTISGISDSFLGEKVTLRDLSGKIVMEFQLKENNQQVDVTSLKSGVYFIEIGESTEKIIIE